MSTCRSCGARVTWLRTTSGKNIPVNEDPDPNGNIVVIAGTVTCAVVDPTQEMDKPHYMPHHATCPQGKDWRRRS